MPILANPQHEIYAQERAKGATQIAAYRTAGYEGDDAHASRLHRRPGVEERIAELMAEAAVQVGVTIDDLVKELEDARLKALGATTPQAAAAVSATLGKAKLLGLIVDKQEHGGPGGGPIKTVSRIERVIVDPAD